MLAKQTFSSSGIQALRRSFFTEAPIIQVLSTEEEELIDNMWGDLHYRSVKDEGGLKSFIPINRSTSTTWDFGSKTEIPDDEDVLSGAVLLWKDEASMAACKESNDIDEEYSREFDIAQPASKISLDTSGKTLDDANYCLVINGVLDNDLSELAEIINSEPAASEFGTAFGNVPGCVCKIFLLDRKGGNVGGGVYLFETLVSSLAFNILI
jgi:hypothetical protein